MDKNLHIFLKSLDLEDEDINVLVETCPGLDLVDEERALLCAKTIVDAGYPECDLDSLICMNPGVLLYNPKDLKKKLSNFHGDIEDILKSNPNVI